MVTHCSELVKRLFVCRRLSAVPVSLTSWFEQNNGNTDVIIY